ncbi:hypothetical protein ACIA58_31500 [Kribbella sp. NPDC051586]|uniref:Rv1733c family protein n=1 Tax=Kribbella sp. NPDC051586 TaxID=3364118 RepID=UPI0037A204EC
MSTVKQRSGEQRVLMQARRLSFGRNPLRRPVDRLEAGLLWSALVAALLMVVVGAAVGTGLRNASNASADQERAVLHETTGRTLQSTEGQVPATPGAMVTVVQVRYIDQQGITREGMAPVVIGTKADVPVMIWLDRTGAIASAPHSAADSVAYGATIGFITVVGSWLLLWGAFRLACVPLNRRRARAWESEWDAVAPRWLRGQR